MGRPPLAVGTFGTIHFERLGRTAFKPPPASATPTADAATSCAPALPGPRPSDCCVKPSATAPMPRLLPYRPTAG
jgi:hypothetical protein